MTEQEKQQSQPKFAKYCNIQKRFIAYDKDTVIEKLEENLDSLFKYYWKVHDGELKTNEHLKSNPTKSYLLSRIENVHNLLSSLVFHQELTWPEYNEFVGNYDLIKKEFDEERKLESKEEIEDHLAELSCFIDSILALSIFEEDEDDIEEEFEDEDDEDNDDEEFSTPRDHLSVINIDNDCKKRKK